MAQVSSWALDPVCGATLEAKDAVGPVFYRGQHYLFCSHRCQSQFFANPPRDIQRELARARAIVRARVSLS